MNKPGQTYWGQLNVEKAIFGALGAVLAFSLLVNLLVLAPSLYMMQVYDRVLVSGQVETLVFVSLIALVALVVLGMLEGMRSFMMTRVGRYLDLKLRDAVLSQVIEQSRVEGDAKRRVLEDFGVIRNYLGSPAILPFMDAPWVPLFLIIIALMHPWLGLLATAAAVVLFGLALANDLLTRKALREANARQSIVQEQALGAMQNAEVIQAMGMQDAIIGRYRRQVADMGAAVQQSSDAGSTITAISKAIRLLVQSMILGLGAYLVIRAELTPGGMIASSIVLGRALAPIEQTIGSWKQSLLALDAYRNVRGFLSAVPGDRARIANPNLNGRLTVEGVSYAIRGHARLTLNRVAFQIDPGTVMALVGPSASGKSTMCRLIVGAISPAAGVVRLDGADVTSLRPEDAATTIGYLPQAVELFSGTVKENIARLGRVDDAAVMAAAKAAGCHDMILRLENGYETELGPRGIFLSGGQRQRIGLARAIYGEPKLVVLDEPNSNLDQEGEAALIEAIFHLKRRGAAVVLVSHRASLLRPVDKVGVLRDGILEKFGNRDEVLREMSPQPTPPRPTLVPNEQQSARSGGVSI